MLKHATVTLLWCGALMALGMNRPDRGPAGTWEAAVRGVLRSLHDRDLNRDADDADVAGYYQGLLAGRPRTLMGRSRDAANYRFRGDFLYYDARPNVDVPEHDGSGRHITNSRGMTDREYSVERPARARRLAFVGDSITRGQGAPHGESFEALLETRLNERHGGPRGETYELLNFGTTGYRLTQMLDVALETVPQFKPDVYVVCLTRLSIGSAWGDHLAQLVYDGVDLKYPYLRELAATARLDPRDPIGTMRAKLEPYQLPTIRWALEQIQERAARDGATVVLMFVPTANTPSSQERRFGPIRDVVAGTNLPIVDLLDVFGGVDLETVKVRPGNDHPNGDGHRMIFERLYKVVLEDRRTAGILLGAEAAGAESSGMPNRTER